jgi:hypothetical protein
VKLWLYAGVCGTASRLSIYARAVQFNTLLSAGWKRAPCGCCWSPPWEEEDLFAWDTDEALDLTSRRVFDRLMQIKDQALVLPRVEQAVKEDDQQAHRQT